MNVKNERGFHVLDLHGVRHGDVSKEIDSFLWQYRDHFNLKIECGNSDPMIKIVTDFLEDANCKWMKSVVDGYGSILVIKD